MYLPLHPPPTTPPHPLHSILLIMLVIGRYKWWLACNFICNLSPHPHPPTPPAQKLPAFCFVVFLSVVLPMSLSRSENSPLSMSLHSRCNCNGNAQSCNLTATPYVCDCDSATYTEGNHCESCMANRFHSNAQSDCQGECDCEAAGVLDAMQMCDMVRRHLLGLLY